MVPYLVSQFSKPTLSNLVKECFGSDFPDVFNKPQVNVLFHYLKDLKAESVLLEREYQDKDYLEDFSRYYVKCFQNSGYKCARLHFFNAELDHTKLDHILMCGKKAPGYGALQESYLGFIVIKPLPKTFIGKTCLKHYPELGHNSLDCKLLSRRYNINLFGVDLHVDSIAFQEQDKVVSACATTAIWSALHGCFWKDDRQIPACSEITTNAINHIDRSNNSFPKNELTNKQILRALDCEGLKYHMEQTPGATRSEILSIVRCHIDSNIPLILVADVYDKDGSLMGGHAVAVLGYKEEGESYSLYVHDDRLGPFAKARMINNGEHISIEQKEDVKPSCLLTLQHKNENGTWLPPHEFLVVSCLIIPAQKKIRISYLYPFNTCQLVVQEFVNWLKEQKSEEAFTEFKGALTFSMQLFQISEIKKAILDTPCPRGSDRDRFMRDRANLLTQSCARFQWVGTFFFRGVRAFRILFDATDIPQGNAITSIFVENPKISTPILQLFKKYSDSNIDDPRNSFIHLIYKYLKTPDSDYSLHLDLTYGHLRAPKYLRSTEISNGDISENPTLEVFYERSTKHLGEIFKRIPKKKGLIWAIAADGGLLIGEDKGHPTLTGFKPARIAGELKQVSGAWKINSKSGRYSRDYPNSSTLLENALFKLQSIFPDDKFNIEILS